MTTALLIIAALVIFNAVIATWLLVRYHREQRSSFCNAVRYADEQSFEAVVDSALRVVGGHR